MLAIAHNAGTSIDTYNIISTINTRLLAGDEVCGAIFASTDTSRLWASFS